MPIQMRPSWMSTSMRSPGPYGGSPETNSRSRSASSSGSDIPNRSAASATLVPWFRTRYGTTVSSRRRRSDAFSGALRAAPERAPSSGGNDRLQPAQGLRSELGGFDGLRVGSERQDPRDQPFPRRPGHPHLDPPVLPGPNGLRARDPLGRPPRDVGRERDRGGALRVAGAPGTRPDVLGGAEALGRLGPLPLDLEVVRDPRQPERSDLLAVEVQADEVPVAAAPGQPEPVPPSGR